MSDFEGSRYKSWGYLKKQMNDLLCEPLKGRIDYFYTSYHEVNNSYGRASINFDKKESATFFTENEWKQGTDVSKRYREIPEVMATIEDFDDSIRICNQVRDELMKEKWMPNCVLCQSDFAEAITVYLKTNIKDSLVSENYLLRIFAYMDRRVGKRTLIKIKDEVAALPEWVQQFYRIRCEAEGLDFKDKLV